MLAIKSKLNQTIIKMSKAQEMYLPAGLLTVTNDVWYSNSFRAPRVLGMCNSSDFLLLQCICGAMCTSHNRTTSLFHDTLAVVASLVLSGPCCGGGKELLVRM